MKSGLILLQWRLLRILDNAVKEKPLMSAAASRSCCHFLQLLRLSAAFPSTVSSTDSPSSSSLHQLCLFVSIDGFGPLREFFELDKA
ncbi:hypothetical protein LINPERHAP2_LOCUS5285 [Linum perenne]